MNMHEGMFGVTKRTAYAKVFMALGFSLEQGVDLAHGDYVSVFGIN